MPQLMPLEWMISNFFVLLLLLGLAIFLYSSHMKFFSGEEFPIFKNSISWCW